jgi:hypothetical protein
MNFLSNDVDGPRCGDCRVVFCFLSVMSFVEAMLRLLQVVMCSFVVPKVHHDHSDSDSSGSRTVSFSVCRC